MKTEAEGSRIGGRRWRRGPRGDKKGKETASPLDPPKGTQPRTHFRLLASRL